MDRCSNSGESSQRRESQKKEDQSAETLCFSKSRLATVGAEPSGQIREEIKTCTQLWREAHVEVKMHKAPQCRNLLEVEIWKKCVPLWREARFKVKISFGAFLEVEMLKKCTPLWCEVHFEVNMLKTWRVRTILGSGDVQKVHAAAAARNTF